MRILDRTIVFRFAWNFALLFTLLFVFAALVDVTLQLEQYLKVAAQSVAAGDHSNRATAFVAMVFKYHGPRVFQFFQFMVGLLAVGAMGFTFAQMHRTRELVAIMAAGVPLRRCVWAVLGAALVLNLLGIVNQELVLPRFADMLLVDRIDLAKHGGSAFPVTLTRDTAGNLLYASSFDPSTGRITGFLGLERDDKGALVRRTTASAATWDEERETWVLEGGSAVVRDASVRDGVAQQPRPVATPEWKTDLSPKAITARHYRLFAQMLSSADLGKIAEAGALDRAQADRMQLGRIGSVLVNLLALAIAVPFFLKRGPANMLQMSVFCAAVCVPAIIVSAVVMAAPLSGLPAAVSVALPIAILIPAAAARISWLPS